MSKVYENSDIFNIHENTIFDENSGRTGALSAKLKGWGVTQAYI